MYSDDDDVVPCFDCEICGLGDLYCVAARHENYFCMASKEQIINRLKNNKFPDERQHMIDTLKEIYNIEWRED